MAKTVEMKLDKRTSAKALFLLRNAPKRMKRAKDIALLRIAAQVMSDGAAKAPFLSGTLRRSIGSKTDGNSEFKKTKNSVTVGSKLVYAAVQEFGYRNIVGKKYMTKAFKTMADGRGSEIFEEEIKTIMT